MSKNAGVAGYVKAFWHVLSESQTGQCINYLLFAVLGGADIDNIFLNTRNFWSEEYAPLCDNCKITFENFKLPKK